MAAPVLLSFARKCSTSEFLEGFTKKLHEPSVQALTGWHFAEELSHSPRMGDQTKTQSPVWTSGDGEKEESGEMDWYQDTDDTDDLPKDPPQDDE